MTKQAIEQLETEMQLLDELRAERAALEQKQASEMKTLDGTINKQFAKVGAIVSIIASGRKKQQ